MTRTLIDLVWDRAESRCEYCLIPADQDEYTFEIDHIYPRVHGGPTEANNLALACWFCNSSKGPNVAGMDDGPRRVVRLFHPRLDSRTKHFEWAGPVLVGRTAVGRVTVSVLRVNAGPRVTLREELIRDDLFP